MTLKAISTILGLICFYPVTGQVSTPKKPKVFEVWVKMNNNPVNSRGILYEIGDSSIFLSKSIQNPSLLEYKYNNINILKIRKAKNLLKGGIIGSGIGFTGSIIIFNLTVGDMDFMTLPMSTLIGLVYGSLGAVCGVLAGSVKDRIPIKNSYINFEKYKGNLQNYSFVHEENPVINIFDHRLYFGTNIGFLIAQDEFISNIPVTDYLGMEKTGFSFKFSSGYRFNKILGMNASLVTTTYSVNFIKDYSSSTTINRTMSWTLDALSAGLVVSWTLNRQFRMDFVPGFVFASTYLMDYDKSVLNGEGFGPQFSGSFVYNYSKRWFASAGIGYFISKQKYSEGGSGEARIINIELGLSYKFGKKSL